jgi:hypothetical protein
MREIMNEPTRGYRAWDKSKNVMVNNVTPINGELCITFINGFRVVTFYDGDLLYSESSGLKDKNEEVIYSWDICLFPTGDKKEIILKDGAYGYVHYGDFIPLCNYKDRHEIEIIGNIFENPELLEKQI